MLYYHATTKPPRTVTSSRGESVTRLARVNAEKYSILSGRAWLFAARGFSLFDKHMRRPLEPMNIIEISIQNYKSLKDVVFQPSRVTLLVGANSSGKSNFCDCIDFVSEVYRLGLEMAVARKGGYENISFRRMRRSRSPISVRLQIETTPSNDYYITRSRNAQLPELRIQHSFSLVAHGYSIRAEFSVVGETFLAEVKNPSGEWEEALIIARSSDTFRFEHNPKFVDDPSSRRKSTSLNYLFDTTDLDRILMAKEERVVSPSELLINALGRFVPVFRTFVRAVERIKVFQISPAKSREFGVPIPRPELDRLGGNLPAVIDVMSKRNKSQWEMVMQKMRSILPDLQSISVDYTTARTLGLLFHEEGYTRPWNVGEISDGTIQTLALLVAIYSSDSTALVIEEPENSVHPWIIRQILEACQEASERKQIIITSHSPVAMNIIPPDDIRVIWRKKGESHIAKLTDLDPDFLHLWQNGDISTFDYLDSGAILEALPPASDQPKE
jgi:predicted ATPase